MKGGQKEMKTQISLIDEKYKAIKVNKDVTIKDLYIAAYSEIGDKYAKAKLTPLREALKAKVHVPQYYKSLIYNSKKTLNLSDETFECVLALLARAYVVAEKCKYSGNVELIVLREAATELSIIETILKILYEDEHTDEDLFKVKITDGYLKQMKINKGKYNETQRAKEIRERILGKKTKTHIEFASETNNII